jgi:hypothetical protein
VYMEEYKEDQEGNRRLEERCLTNVLTQPWNATILQSLSDLFTTGELCSLLWLPHVSSYRLSLGEYFLRHTRIVIANTTGYPWGFIEDGYQPGLLLLLLSSPVRLESLPAS